ncbi:hypothetical protein F4859DRAFT_520055 [Xylaria cf. heliscus]|nr:hypothetical protein F4859DRAFT_520055 [Xylaria cf. heliscus]
MSSTNPSITILAADANLWLDYVGPTGTLLTNVQFDVDCILCQNKIASSAGAPTHQFVILPCGHIFGADCVTDTLRENNDPRCPACTTVLRTCTHKIELRRFEFCQSPSLFLAMRSVLKRDSSCIICECIFNSEIERVLATIPSPQIPTDFEATISTMQATLGANSTLSQYLSWFRGMVNHDRTTIAVFLFLLGVHKGKPESGIPRPIPDWLQGQASKDPLGRLAELAIGCKVDDSQVLQQFQMACQMFVSEYLKEYYTKGFPW